MSAAMDLFSDLDSVKDVQRPNRYVDLLLGIQHAGLHPVGPKSENNVCGNLRLLESKFGSG